MKVGDVVQPKNGGEKMTIETIGRKSGEAVCIYFIGSELKKEKVSLNALKKVE